MLSPLQEQIAEIIAGLEEAEDFARPNAAQRGPRFRGVPSLGLGWGRSGGPDWIEPVRVELSPAEGASSTFVSSHGRISSLLAADVSMARFH